MTNPFFDFFAIKLRKVTETKFYKYNLECDKIIYYTEGEMKYGYRKNT